MGRRARARRLWYSSRGIRITAAVLAGLATSGCTRGLAPGLPPAWGSPVASPAAVRGPAGPAKVGVMRARWWVPQPMPAPRPEPPPAPAQNGAPASLPAAPPPGPQPGPAAPPHDPAAKRYTLLPGVTLSQLVKDKVTRIADAYHRRTGKELVITSGTRDAADQAEAMHELLQMGADVASLYKNKSALKDIQRAYDEARAAAKPTAGVVAAMAEVIRRQMEKGIFISAHLRAGAVDVRNRDMTTAEKRALLDAVAEVGGVTALEESRPPHYHLQVD